MTTQPRLIALTGAKGVGKSTYAEFLAGENGTVLSFATPIKHMLRSLVGHEYVFGNRKNEETHLGVTGRVLLQTLGTEWGREMIDQDIVSDSELVEHARRCLIRLAKEVTTE